MTSSQIFDRWSVSGRTALVTGASSGLGRHFAGLLAQAGADVILAARRADRLAEACEAIAAEGGKARAVALDVTDPDSVAKLFAELTPDIVINNAGIATHRPALDVSEDDWDSVVDTNLKGAFLVAQAAARHMAKNGGGSIINIASILGIRVAGHVAAYAASKAGLIQLTKSLALEWARHGIRVNALCPGYVVTEINADFFESDAGAALIKRIPQRRVAKPEELDGALLLLASDAGAYITGTVLAVDGGHLVSGL